MTGHRGNSEFCFPEAKPSGTLRSRGNKTHCFPRGQSVSVLLYLPELKNRKNSENNDLLDAIAYTGCGCQNQPVLSKNHDNSQLTKNIDGK